MPEVKIKHIVSFSSEESSHKAENLLSGDTSRKWKCVAGEKQAAIVFQLDKSTELSSIDIGNEGSAFVEVLVGRSSNNNVQYQVLLVASSFMSPQESRQGTSPNRVRIFNKDKLSPDIASQKWDLVKLVCTQPFNKRTSYGLSLVKFHTLVGDIKDIKTEAESSSPTEVNQGRKTFGGFKLKEEKKEAGNFNPGVQMLMAKKEQSTTSVKQEDQRRDSRRRSRSPDTRKTIEEKRRKIDKPLSSTSSSTPAKSTPVKFDTLKQKKPSNPQTPKQTSAPTTSTKNTKKPTKTKKKKPKRPYDQILNGVVFVISGFQNPLRGEIREKAKRMGAQYRKDWTSDSTHLVCAFINTPKYRQVIGLGGKIVRKDWIEDCSSRKQLISWKKYSMNPDESSESSSEEEEQEEEEEVTRIVRKNTSQDPVNTKTADSEDEEDPYGGSTDEEGDTEDEIEKVQAKNVKSEQTTTKANGADDDDDIYNQSTDEEPQPDENGDDKLPPLPDYFNDKEFLLYGDFQSDRRKLLRRHIIACGGKISDYMNDDVEYVITEQQWDDNFEQALASNAGLLFVKPSWVFQCSRQQKIVPYQPHVVSHS